MTAAQTVSKYLPFLRRYARALTGSQSSGDAYVAATLETLVKDPDLLNSASHPKVALFHIFTSIWNSVPVNGAKEAIASPVPAERRISQLTPRPRQAFLLVSLEGFSDDAAAEILGGDVNAFRSLVDEAGRELAAEIASIPEFIRGYGPVKERHLRDAKAREAELLAQWSDPDRTVRTRIPIRAAA